MEPGCSIDQLVDAWQRVCILGTRPVEIGVVSAHPPFSIGLFYHDDVGELGRVPDFSDEIVFEELIYFLSYGLTSFFSHLTLLL